MLLRHPISQTPIGDAWIDLYSLDSEVARRHTRTVASRRSRRVQPDEVDANTVALLVALTAGWELAAPDGAPLDLPFSAEGARELYSDPGCAWLREQVEAFVADRQNYIPDAWK